MLLVSTPTIAGGGFDTLEFLGLVRSTAFLSGVREKDDFSDPLQDGVFYSSRDGFDRFATITKNLEDDLTRQARELNANCVVDTKFTQSIATFDDHRISILVTASGTAALMRSR